MIEPADVENETTPAARFQAAQQQVAEQRRLLEKRLEEIEKERVEIRTLLGRTRTRKAAVPKPARKAKKNADQAAAALPLAR